MSALMNEFRYKCWTKATDQEMAGPRYSPAWATARRAWFKVFDNRIECGDWVIPVSSIRAATLYEATQFFIPVFVLKLSTAARTYQFGFNPWCRVARFLPFEVERQRVKLKYSTFSWVLRFLVVLMAIAYLWNWWR